MNFQSSIAWFFLNVVGIAVAAVFVFDFVNLARKASGRLLILPQYLVARRARSMIVIALLGVLAAVAVAFALTAWPA
jgi:hypothetical protein